MNRLRFQSTEKEFRNILKNNSVPIKYDLQNDNDYKDSQKNHISYYDRIYGRYLDELVPNRSAKILEIGCAEDLFLGYLKYKGYTNYLGIDLSENKIEIAKKYHLNKVKVSDAFTLLSELDEYYNLIVLNFVLEHINKEKMHKFIRQIYSSIIPGGGG